MFDGILIITRQTLVYMSMCEVIDGTAYYVTEVFAIGCLAVVGIWWIYRFLLLQQGSSPALFQMFGRSIFPKGDDRHLWRMILSENSLRRILVLFRLACIMRGPWTKEILVETKQWAKKGAKLNRRC